jgi:hypothetical protein
MTAPLDARPRPLVEAFRSVGSAVALISSVATALVGWGVMSAAQGDATVALLGAVPGVVTLVGSLLTAFGVISRAEPAVTPISDPAVQEFPGGPLVSLVPAQD